MKIEPVSFPVIPPLVHRHAEDAAFYWSQLDSAERSPHFGLARYTHFNQVLDAHLEGLLVAGAEGIAPALNALKRWKGPAEAFACAWLAIQVNDADANAALLAQVRKQPDTLLRGLTSALAWAPRENTLPWLVQLGAVDAPVPDQVAALRAAALIGPDGVSALPSPLTAYIASPHGVVRAAACRAARPDGERCTSALGPALRAAARDNDLAVRAEASIAMARCGMTEGAAAVLWQCVATQADIHAQSTGWYRKQATRRLQRWVRHLAAITPLGHADIQQLLDWLPARIGLMFTLHHGDAAYLPHVLALMADPSQARYAGWVWQMLTGIDLATHGLVLPEPDQDDTPDAVTDAKLDADQGLPLPNIEAIRCTQAATALRPGVRSLLGQPITPSYALALLETAPQALRSIAAQALTQMLPGSGITVRGPALAQQRHRAALLAQVMAYGDRSKS